MTPSTPEEPSSGDVARPRPARGRRPAPPRLGRQLVIFVLLVAALLVAVAAVTGDRGYLDVRRQKAQLSRIRAEVASLGDENETLLGEVRGLRSDPYVNERIAREKLGYALPGEIIFRFPPADPPVRETPPPQAGKP